MGVILCEFESRPPHPNEKRKIERFSSFSLYAQHGHVLVMMAQRKKSVVLQFATTGTKQAEQPLD